MATMMSLGPGMAACMAALLAAWISACACSCELAAACDGRGLRVSNSASSERGRQDWFSMCISLWLA